MPNILFILTGSIACYKACDAISQLVQRGHQVRAVATEAALRFVGAATLEGLTREKVATDLFEAGRALDHIELTRWAELVLVCPATANTLNRMAAGLGDDLAGALWLAHDWRKPLLVAPAMNPEMWKHPATRASVRTLREWGVRFVAPGAGRTACGEVGEGRLAEPDDLVAAVEAALVPAAQRRRVLITSGGTAEPIDGVRMITNASTGETGALIAERCAASGHDVLLLRSRSGRSTGGRCREETFVSFAELDAALARHLSEENFDVIIHAAAVSDFSVEAVEVNGVTQRPGAAKLASSVAPTVRLRVNPKLLDTLRGRSRNPQVCVVAFKLTNGAGPEDVRTAVEAITRTGAADYVVHNDLAARTADGGVFPAEIWNRAGEIVQQCADRRALAEALERVVSSDAMSGASTPNSKP